MSAMTSSFSFHVVLIACAGAGLLIAFYIHRKKRLHEPLTCPIGHPCDPVIHSRYSRFLDMPVELLGVIYYTIVVVAYIFFLTTPALAQPFLSQTLLTLSGIAFLFSLYLTAVQTFILREWCTWCLISAALCAVIFFVGLRLAGIEISGFLLRV